MAWPSGRQVVVHLLRELAGRHEDQAARGAAAVLDLAADAGQQRQAEGQRLAGAGGGLAEHVAPGEGVRQGGGLDGERAVDAAPLERGDQRLGQAQLAEGRAVGLGAATSGVVSVAVAVSAVFSVVLSARSTRTTQG